MSFLRRISERRKKDKESGGKGSTLKSPTTPGILKSPQPVDVNGLPGTPQSSSKTKSGEASLLLIQDEYHPGDLGVSLDPSQDFKQESKFNRNLSDIIHDHEAVPYLIQYMDSCKASALIRFWLDAESFQASTWTRIRTHSLQSVSKSSLMKEKSTPVQASIPKSKSAISKDITSPDSEISLDCVVNEGESESSATLSASAHNSQTDTKLLDKPGSAESNDFQSSQPNNQSSKSAEEIQTDQSESSTLSVAENQQNSENCDSRVREKCKSGATKDSLSLPLTNCDTSEMSTSNAEADDKVKFTQSAYSSGVVNDEQTTVIEPKDRNGSESAISYRDIATPSPSGSCASSITDSSVNIKSGASNKSSATSTANLAEKLKKSVEQDAVRIFTKYLAQESTHPIGITDDLRNDTIRQICREDGQVDPECFVECQKFALTKIQERYFDGYKASAFHCKYQVEMATGGKLHITDVLYFESALFYFMEYLEQEGLSHLLHFVIAADNFERMLTRQESYDGLQAQEDAMVLYDKYFSLQAAVPLGFPDNVRFEVESNICREEGPLPECFAKPRHIVLHTLEKRHFQHYLTSNVYYKYLSELVSTLQTIQDFPIGQRKRRGSETSSEHSVGAHSVGSESISSKNTLLAVGTSRPVQLSKLEENMKNFNMDDSLLMNPDQLWERPASGKMSLGKIDTLGQFVSSFDPDPESVAMAKKKSANSSGTGGSRFFRSKKEKEKEQEEMARKVAEMILKDVASVNQAIGEMKNPGTQMMPPS